MREGGNMNGLGDKRAQVYPRPVRPGTPHPTELGSATFSHKGRRGSVAMTLLLITDSGGWRDGRCSPFLAPCGVRSGRPLAGEKPTIWLFQRRTPEAIAEGR